MPYNPGVSDISGQLRAQGMTQGMNSLLKGFDEGLKTYQMNNRLANDAVAKFGATLANSDSMKALLTDENARAGAPSNVVKAYLKLQKDGNLGVRDATLLGSWADSYAKGEEEKQQRQMRTQQMKQMEQYTQASVAARQLAEENQGFTRQDVAAKQGQRAKTQQMNDFMQMQAGMGNRLDSGTAPIPANAGGGLGNLGTARDAGPMNLPIAPGEYGSYKTVLPTPGNLAGGGVLRPEVAQQAQDFANSSAGQMAQAKVPMTPEDVMKLHIADMGYDTRSAKLMQDAAKAAQGQSLAEQRLALSSLSKDRIADPYLQSLQQMVASGKMTKASADEAMADYIKRKGTIPESPAAQFMREMKERDAVERGVPTSQPSPVVPATQSPFVPQTQRTAVGVPPMLARLQPSRAPVLTPEQVRNAPPNTYFTGSNGQSYHKDAAGVIHLVQ